MSHPVEKGLNYEETRIGGHWKNWQKVNQSALLDLAVEVIHVHPQA